MKKRGAKNWTKVLGVKKECEEDEERKRQERKSRQERGIDEYLNLISWQAMDTATTWMSLVSLVQSHLHDEPCAQAVKPSRRQLRSTTLC
jgi:hypothetical protein